MQRYQLELKAALVRNISSTATVEHIFKGKVPYRRDAFIAVHQLSWAAAVPLRSGNAMLCSPRCLQAHDAFSHQIGSDHLSEPGVEKSKGRLAANSAAAAAGRATCAHSAMYLGCTSPLVSCEPCAGLAVASDVCNQYEINNVNIADLSSCHCS